MTEVNQIVNQMTVVFNQQCFKYIFDMAHFFFICSYIRLPSAVIRDPACYLFLSFIWRSAAFQTLNSTIGSRPPIVSDGFSQLSWSLKLPVMCVLIRKRMISIGIHLMKTSQKRTLVILFIEFFFNTLYCSQPPERIEMFWPQILTFAWISICFYLFIFYLF